MEIGDEAEQSTGRVGEEDRRLPMWCEVVHFECVLDAAQRQEDDSPDEAGIQDTDVR